MYNVAQGILSHSDAQVIDTADILAELEEELRAISLTSEKTDPTPIPIKKQKQRAKGRSKRRRAGRRKVTTFGRLSSPQRRTRLIDAFCKNAPPHLRMVSFHLPDDMIRNSKKTVTGVAHDQVQYLLDMIERRTGKRPTYFTVVEFVDDDSKISKTSINPAIGAHVHLLIELPRISNKIFQQWALNYSRKHMPNREHNETTITIKNSGTPVYHRSVYNLSGALNYVCEALGHFDKRAKELGFEIDPRRPLRPLATSDHIRKIAEETFIVERSSAI